ncbi:fimbrillin family protein [Octadecabacter sp. CECT 8868]|uniref:fimbrillin family protein n=1 Tax=Octadecabacter algicola TaxID=2909342 RepID=UPI001F23297B|nr:fimbrillin family protein [Octadecabacter algicola]MCF2903573.1 fimbrillin family protein [Octadecabacter algicola]
MKVQMPLSLLAFLTLSACSGEIVASAMPGEAITVNGNAFTVSQTDRGVTVQNFETGRTNPAVLIVNAGLAAERVTGCTVEDIVKDGITNTYYASMACPE